MIGVGEVGCELVSLMFNRFLELELMMMVVVVSFVVVLFWVCEDLDLGMEMNRFLEAAAIFFSIFPTVVSFEFQVNWCCSSGWNS